MKFYGWMLIVFCLMTTACSTRHTAYTAGGAAVGAGVGYSYHHDDKEAAIGGLVGAGAGALLGEMSHRHGKKKFQKGFDEGYAQARVDLAQEYWDETTGRGVSQKNPKLKEFKVPQQVENGVVYEEHTVVLEDYR